MLARRAGKLQFAADLCRAESVEDLIRRLYEGIDCVFDSVVVGFDLLEPSTHRPQSTSGHGVSAYFLAKYDQVARDADPVLRHAITSRNLAYNLAMMSEVEWRELSVYRDVFSMHHMVGIVYAPIVVDGEVVATLNLGRAEGAAAFTPTELDDAVEVAALVGALMASLQRREAAVHQLELYRDALDAANEAVVISDVRRAERYVNRAAQRVLDEQPKDAPSFDEAFIEVRHRGAGHELIQRSVAINDGDAFVSFLHAESRFDVLPEWLQHTLTARESEVVLLVAQGLRDAEIATTLNLSVHTVKGYLREIFKKTGSRSRVELARMAVARDSGQ